ncbi:hypothetical protein CRX72_07725 [Pantoea sp. BRM17]|nr:hypothetical protein PSNIH1_07820 [Pantoea sp. PSNIH1]PPS57886.1 hypothetical protein CRX72_07725 [Pantoea sp. BRM17]
MRPPTIFVRLSITRGFAPRRGAIHGALANARTEFNDAINGALANARTNSITPGFNQGRINAPPTVFVQHSITPGFAPRRGAINGALADTRTEFDNAIHGALADARTGFDNARIQPGAHKCAPYGIYTIFNATRIQ